MLIGWRCEVSERIYHMFSSGDGVNPSLQSSTAGIDRRVPNLCMTLVVRRQSLVPSERRTRVTRPSIRTRGCILRDEALRFEKICHAPAIRGLFVDLLRRFHLL